MCSILVIDDEKEILDFMQTALSEFGHNVEVAEDGLKGIQKFDKGNFDIVITDMEMPILDGRGVVRHIRASNKKSSLIFGMSGTPWQLENLDFDVTLSKPFQIAELVDTVTRLSN